MIELLAALTLFAAQDGDDANPRDMAERTVAAAIDAHNAHDLEGFLATMAEDVVFLSLDGDVLVEGRAAVADIWGRRFEERPNLVAEILHRTVIGNRVIDDELLCLNGLDQPCVQLVAIYTVDDSLIQTMHVIQTGGGN
ncbi:nuclear transport factor 2 family protein [Hyphobacterium sp.]|uniref:nuclear transport factor 2 family protein n=1 Tax=Hyphobacterium sp. TaxID=2004662 RepID=UPI003BA99454